jgi:predicted enzyme related to lactoylglutathione lyase
MVTRSTAWPAGTPCWIDLAVADRERAIAFYTGLFGWEVDEEGTCRVDGRRVAGIRAKQRPDQPTAWTTYLAADDVAEVAGRITEAGGRVLVEPLEITDGCRMAVAVDATGAAFGVWQAIDHIGTERANEPSTLVWNEQLSGDLEGAKRFYATTFGYTYSSFEAWDDPYVMCQVDGETVGGLGAFGSDAPAAHWRPYFLVPDTDAATATVVSLGGQVLVPPRDTPVGRLAGLADDQGATFFVIQGS